MPEKPPQPPGGPPRLLCRCLGVSSPRIIKVVQSQGLTRLEEVQEAIRAGTGCGTCHGEIEEILADLAGEEVPRLTRIQNRWLCQSETLQRIEGSLMGGILPKLPPGTKVEVVSVKGLEVNLHLAPDDTPELRELISVKLRNFVCADFEIDFS